MRRYPSAFAGRCANAFVEVVAAAAILIGAVVVGHDLRAWREWYADPSTAHPWAPTPVPTAVAEPLAR